MGRTRTRSAPGGRWTALAEERSLQLVADSDGGVVARAGAERVRQTLDNLREVFRCVTPYFVHIPLYGSVWGFACASDTLDPRAVTPEHVERVLAERGVGDLQYYNGEVHRALFALPNYIRALVG